MTSGSKKKETQICSFFLFKVPVKEPLPGSPTGPLWAGLPVYKVFFYIYLEFLIKISLNKEIFPFSQMP